jgi:tetratricopeptide (TPR) repeat protein
MSRSIRAPFTRLTAFVATLALVVGVQGQSTRMTAPPNRVFVTAFLESGGPERIPGLGVFTSNLITVELIRRIPLSVLGTRTVPECPNENITGAPATPVVSSTTMAPGEYVISGSVQIDSSSFSVRYVVTRCTSAGPVVIHESEPEYMPWREASIRLPSLASAAVAVVEGDLPGNRVSLGDITLRGSGLPDGADAGLAESLVGALASARGFVPASSDSVADYIVRGWIEGIPGRPRVRIGVVLAAPKLNWRDTIRTEGPRDSVYAVYAEASRRAFGRLRVHRWSSQRDPGFALAERSLDSLIVLAQRALECVETVLICDRNRNLETAAVAAFAATEVSPQNRPAQVLLARTEQLRGNYPESVSLLTHAWNAWRRDQGRGEAEGTTIVRNLAESYQQIGNHVEAARLFALAYEMDPAGVEAVLAQVRSLKELGRDLEALEVLGDVLRARDENPAIIREILGFVEQADAARILNAMPALRRSCSFQVRVRAACAAALIRRGSRLYAQGTPEASVLSLVRTGLALEPTDRTVVAEAYALLAGAHLGIALHVPAEGGETLLTFPRARADSVQHYLRRAGAFSATELRPELREWLLRTEALFRMGSKDYSIGYRTAREAHSVLPVPTSRLTMGIAAYLLARERHSIALQRDTAAVDLKEALLLYRESAEQLEPLVGAGHSIAYRYYRAANHHLDRDRASQAQLAAAVAARPNDRAARTALTHVCLEYLKDFQCGYELAADWERRGLLANAVDSLGAVEAAVLAGNYEVAERWMEPLAVANFTPCNRAVTHALRVWIASARAPEELPQAFEAWRVAVHDYRRSGPTRCWIFDGALDRLSREPAVPQAALLRSMIRAHEDPQSELPVAPATPLNSRAGSVVRDDHPRSSSAALLSGTTSGSIRQG